ncbi:MAG TPA: kynureninase [Gammaproteobacteria bacterium]|nr:kynureninase [Gammaproteobacteria bacterium]
MNEAFNRQTALRLDHDDPLAGCRERFHLPRRENGDEEVYLCGNSLGLQPLTAADYVQQELEDWRLLGVKGHFAARNPWMPYHEFLTERTARLVGALPDEVVTMNTLTVNLHLMMVTFYRPTPARHRILIEKPAFPSDRYAVESQIRFHGYDPAEALVELGPRPGETFLRMEDIEAAIAREGERLALVLFPGVQYYSGQAFDLARIVAAGHRVGARVGFDLAHAVGNVPLALHESDADFAVWCNYKYMNGGPGAVAGCFVHARHARDTNLPRFAGWWGHDKATRFRMGPEFHPIPTAEGWQLSNPPILSLAPLLASLAIFDEVGMPRLREKSLRLTGYLETLLRERLADRVEILTPADPAQRGCQISLRITHGDGRRTFERLEADGIVCDWREPDVIRAAPVPLYNRFMDCYRFVEALERAIE